MALFMHIPPEIQRYILGCLTNDDLRTLCLVRRNWRSQIETILYTDVCISWKRQEEPRIKLLIRTIISRPDLARSIKNITIHHHGFSMPHQCCKGAWNIKKRCPGEIDIDKATEFINRTGMETSKIDAWITDLKAGDLDGQMALLLALLPNLTSIDFSLTFRHGTVALGSMLKAALCQPRQSDSVLPKFTNLQKITFPSILSRYHPGNIDGNEDMLPFLYAPNIKRLINFPVASTPEFIWPGETPDPSTLIELTLNRLREPRLEPFLSVLSGLKKLHWIWTYQERVDMAVSKDVIELDTITTAMSKLRTTLEDLTIEGDCYGGGRHFYHPVLKMQGSLEGLTNLVNLKRFKVPWIFLMGYSPSSRMKLDNIFPNSIQSIVITDDLTEFVEPEDILEWNNDSVSAAVTLWLENDCSSLTKLRSISFEMERIEGKELCEKLKHINSQISVKVEIIGGLCANIVHTVQLSSS